MFVYVPVYIYKKENDENLYLRDDSIINKSDLYFNDNYLNLKRKLYYPYILDDNYKIYNTNDFEPLTNLFIKTTLGGTQLINNVNENIRKDLLKTIKFDNYFLYRGLNWKKKNNEFYNSVKDNKLYKVGDTITLDLKNLSSWSLCKYVAEKFSRGYFGIILSINIKKEDILLDLSRVNQGIHDNEFEVLIKPKTYSCKIENLFLKEINVNSMEEWARFASIDNADKSTESTESTDNANNDNVKIIEFLVKQENDYKSNYNYNPKIWYNILNNNEKYRIVDTFVKKNIKYLECGDLFYDSLNLINPQTKINLITYEKSLLQKIISQPCKELNIFKVYYVLDLKKKELVEFFNNFKNRKIYKINEECEIKINNDFLCKLNYSKINFENKYGIILSTTLKKKDIINCTSIRQQPWLTPEDTVLVKKGRYNFKIDGLFLDDNEITSMDEWASSNFKKQIKTTGVKIVDSEKEHNEENFTKNIRNYGMSFEDCINVNGNPLWNALKYSNPKVIKKILDLNPDVNIKNDEGLTPLMYALRKFSSDTAIDIANKILDLNPDVNIKNNDGDASLSFALSYSKPDIIINRILDLHPEVNVQNNEGDTSLILALKGSTPEIIHRVLDLSAAPEVNVKNNKGDTPLTYALKYSNTKVINRIKTMMNQN